MYKNLSLTALGVTGRQSELIELALTYGFKGIDLDVVALAHRADSTNAEYACRFVQSAGIKIGGFELPVRWQGSEAEFRADLAQLPDTAELAKSIQAGRCYTTVLPASDELPYHENFESQRTRLNEIGDELAKHEMVLGVDFLAAPAHREGHEFQFIHQAEELCTLVKAVGNAQVGLAVDWWNWQLGGGTLEHLAEQPIEQIILVRLADLPPDADPATVDESQRLLPSTAETSTTPQLLTMLAEKGFEGPLTIYPHPSQFSGMTRDAIAKRVSELLDEQLKAAGLSKTGKIAVAAEG